MKKGERAFNSCYVKLIEEYLSNDKLKSKLYTGEFLMKKVYIQLIIPH